MAPARRLLIMGGTSEARKLADETMARWGDSVDVVTSLAGRTSDARLPKGRIRTGGFGGQAGIESYLRDESVDAVLDATHPFASEITRHATAACHACGVPHAILDRPRWDIPGGLEVVSVADMAEAADAIRKSGASSVLVTVGHRGLEDLAGAPDTRFVIRQIEAHEAPLPLANAERVIQRPPYTVDGECRLMREHGIDMLLTKESGGEATAAKLHAARTLGVPVVMIRRPPLPEGPTVQGIDQGLAWIASTLGLETA